MSEPTFTYHRYNELGELLFFVDFYDDKTTPPFDHFFEGHPTYFISFYGLAYYNFFDEVIEYFVDKFSFELALDKQTLDLLMNNALDRILHTIKPSDLETVPAFYRSKDLSLFRKDKVELDVLRLLLSSDTYLFNDWDKVIRISMNYYNSYGEEKFNRIFPFTIKSLEHQQFVAAVSHVVFNEELLNSLNDNASCWIMKMEEATVFFILNEDLKLVAYKNQLHKFSD